MNESVNRFTLIENDEYWKYEIENESEQTCFLCGNKIEFCGFDFLLENVDKFICKKCAAIHAPELIELQENALFYVKVSTSRERDQLFTKLTETINAVFSGVSK